MQRLPNFHRLHIVSQTSAFGSDPLLLVWISIVSQPSTHSRISQKRRHDTSDFTLLRDFKFNTQPLNNNEKTP